jgi:hypothetical protein
VVVGAGTYRTAAGAGEWVSRLTPHDTGKFVKVMVRPWSPVTHFLWARCLFSAIRFRSRMILNYTPAGLKPACV